MNASDFKKLFLPCTRRVFWAAYRMTGSREEADDIVQETYLKLWMKRAELGDIDMPEAYAIATMRRIFIDKMRLKKIAGTETADNIPSGETPLATFIHKERAQIVREQIALLPEQQRELVTLRDLCELTYDEIAATTGLPLTNIRTAISRGRKTLRDNLKEIL